MTDDSKSVPQARELSGCSTGAILVLTFAVVFVGVSLIGAWHLFGRLAPPPQPTKFESQGPTITQVQSLGSLTVLKVSVADVLTAEGGGYRAAWLVKGDALIAVDCRKAEIESRNDEEKQAVLVLPTPTTIQPRVDHSKTKQWDEKKVTWIPFTGDPSKIRQDAMRQAQELVEYAAKQPELIDQGKHNAQLVIQQMYKLVGWNVEVKWKE